MKTILRVFAVLVLVASVAPQTDASGGNVEKTFDGIRTLKIQTVSGDCIVTAGGGDQVSVSLSYTFNEDDYESVFQQDGDRLVLKERFHGRNNRGESVWRLTVPAGVDIDFSSASGEFEVEGVIGTVEAETASGDIRLLDLTGDVDVSSASGDILAEDLEGDLELSTASGDVELVDVSGDMKASSASGNVRGEDLHGEIKLSSASGNVRVEDATGEFKVSAASGSVVAADLLLQGKSSFSSASGNVELELADSPRHDLNVSSASGDAILNFAGHEIAGTVEMTAKVKRGEIRAPFDFDHEEIERRGRDDYVTKTVAMGGSSPLIKVSTGSGKAVVRER